MGSFHVWPPLGRVLLLGPGSGGLGPGSGGLGSSVRRLVRAGAGREGWPGHCWEPRAELCRISTLAKAFNDNDYNEEDKK